MRTRSGLMVLLGATWVCSSTLLAGCVERIEGCAYTGRCAPASGGSGGEAGDGSAGAGGAGGASGSGGQGGDGCEGACGGTTALCDTETASCVECLERSHCTGDRPVCDPDDHTCVQCVGDPDCSARAEKARCQTQTQTCVACLEDAHCGDASASRCEAGACTPCETNDDCAHIEGKGVCDAGACVECTGLDYAACGTDATSGAARVCHSLTRTCSIDTVHSASVCQACVSDAQCRLGQACVLQRFGQEEEEVGYFCFWKQGDPDGGAPQDCPTQAPPYVRVLSQGTSIDGQAAAVCGLRTSTCPARNVFSAIDCGSGGSPDDSLCGFAPPRDGRCVPFGAGYRCTMTCISHDDCPGPSGTTGVCTVDGYCEL